jgi:hypothetical protein
VYRGKSREGRLDHRQPRLNRPAQYFDQRPFIGSSEVGSEVPVISILLDSELLSVVPP